MENLLLPFLNVFFFIFHTVLILFNLFGWIFPRTRKLHLFTLGATLFSWIILGIWKGFGYCFLTDWHYEVLRKLGKTDLPNSYIAFLVMTVSGWIPDADLVEIFTVILMFLALVCSVWVNMGTRTKKTWLSR